MTKPLWIPLFSLGSALILCAWLSAAHAMVRPDTETPDIRPQPLADAQKTAPRCMRPGTVIVLLRYSDGRVLLLPVMVQVPC